MFNVNNQKTSINHNRKIIITSPYDSSQYTCSSKLASKRSLIFLPQIHSLPNTTARSLLSSTNTHHQQKNGIIAKNNTKPETRFLPTIPIHSRKASSSMPTRHFRTQTIPIQANNLDKDDDSSCVESTSVTPAPPPSQNGHVRSVSLTDTPSQSLNELLLLSADSISTDHLPLLQHPRYIPPNLAIKAVLSSIDKVQQQPQTTKNCDMIDKVFVEQLNLYRSLDSAYKMNLITNTDDMDYNISMNLTNRMTLLTPHSINRRLRNTS